MSAAKTPRARVAPSSKPESAHAEREALLRQQNSLGKFGEMALRSDDLDSILNEGCRLVGEALGTDLAKIITLEDGGKNIFVRAGVGWPPGVVGELKIALEEDSADRFALESGEPTIAANAKEERRYKIAEFVLAAGVQAFVNTPIIGTDDDPPFGILEVDSRRPRQFTQNDIDFLKTYANMIAAAVERHRSSAALRDRADQRMQLLNELQHRLKNNLQSVYSMVGMAMRETTDERQRDVLRSLLTRIDALKLVHEKIYASGQLDRVDLAPYLGELSASLLRFHQTERKPIRLVSDLRPLIATPDTAVPLGLILTEFITNSMKYAFTSGGGIISLQLDIPRAGEGRLVLADNGKGIKQAGRGGTGMRLIEGLAQQLRASFGWKTGTGTGTELTVKFPVTWRRDGPTPER